MRLLPVISLMMNSQESSPTGYSPHELFLGRPAWFLHVPYPEDTHSSVGEWVQEQQAKVDKAKAIEAVPRTPRLGYGIQPVSGPLTPCTEGKTGLRSTNPMYRRRPSTPGASPAGACSVP